MPGLFKRSRLAALRSERFTNYVIYAVGEIILVVVGILIALQANNWNESRKAVDRQHALLTSIRQEIAANAALIRGAQGKRDTFLARLNAVSEQASDEKRRQLVFDVQPEEDRFPGWPGASPVSLTSAMFEAGKSGGTLAGLDPQVLAQLSKTYGKQGAINAAGRVFLGHLYAINYRTHYGDVIRLLWRIQEEFFGSQILLLRDYDKTMATIDAELESR